MGNKPLVSIVIPCYNQGCFLGETLDSVLAQTYDNWECIIVNDGSSDNTEDVFEQYSEKDKRIKYIYQTNKGLSDARNTGVQASRGKYILPLDSDDKIGSTYLEKAVKVLEENDNMEIVYCRAEMFGIKSGEWKLPQYSIEQILGENCIFCSAFFRKSTYEEVQGYKENMKFGLEDWDFWLGILEKKGTECVFMIDEVLFYYRIRKKSMIRSFDEEKIYQMRKQLWLNHRKLYADFFMSPINTFEYRLISRSREYKLGRVLLRPVKYFINLIRR